MSREGPARRYRQHVPRPDGAVPVEPAAAFARLSPAQAGRLARLSTAERAFAAALATPGGETLREAAGTPLAAVLLALVGGEEPSIVLIRRAGHLSANPGEIAFPGGRLEPGEAPYDAARREAFEEVGLRPELLSLLGPLPPVARASRPEPIAPFVAGVAGDPELSANPGEVEALVVTPLADLVDASRYWEEQWLRPQGIEGRMPFFDLGEDLLWGASARILVSLLDLLARFA